ncbi:hypothetical protein [Rhizobium yanglingense]
MRCPSSHATVRTVPYMAVHGALGFMVPNARRPYKRPGLISRGSARYLRLGPLARHLLKAVGKAVPLLFS